MPPPPSSASGWPRNCPPWSPKPSSLPPDLQGKAKEELVRDVFYGFQERRKRMQEEEKEGQEQNGMQEQVQENEFGVPCL